MDSKLKGIPMAVCGSTEDRHGIVLAKSYEAKAFGIKTGMTTQEAKKRCPGLVTVKPHYDEYMRHSAALREIYAEHSDRVEPFGVDECWLDLSSGIKKLEDGYYVSKVIRHQVKKELGLTVSVGVSFNKVFAKLGSDLKKPDGSTLISRENFKKTVWPLPVFCLLGVGRSTFRTLEKYGLTTVGALARCNLDFLRKVMGKNGETIWAFANGLDTAPVLTEAERPPVKSVGNGMTPPRDLMTAEEVRTFMLWLSLEVGARLRRYGMRCGGVNVALRDTGLNVKQFRAGLEEPTDDGAAIAAAAYGLFCCKGLKLLPLRSVSVTAIELESSLAPVQTSLFADTGKTEKAKALNKATDAICARFGKNAITPAVLVKDSFFNHKATLDKPSFGVYN